MVNIKRHEGIPPYLKYFVAFMKITKINVLGDYFKTIYGVYGHRGIPIIELFTYFCLKANYYVLSSDLIERT
jgi:hypothetical protein